MASTNLAAAIDKVAAVRATGSADAAHAEALLRAGVFADRAAPIVKRISEAVADLERLYADVIPAGTSVERCFGETRLGFAVMKLVSLGPVADRDWPDAAVLAERHAQVKLAEVG